MALENTLPIIFAIIHDLTTANDGISAGEITQKYDIKPRTVSKYMRLIEDIGVPLYTEAKRYYIDEKYKQPLILTLPESEFLYMALEGALTEYSSQWGIVKSLINKLSTKLPDALGDYLSSKVNRESRELQSAQWFTMLVTAKIERLEAIVEYYPLNQTDPSKWVIRPYRFVSNPLSDGFYVLCDGTRDGHSYISLSLKFDRIFHVELTQTHFDIVDLARFKTHDGRAWGVWNSQRDPQLIKLRFEPKHYDRLLESTWHPTQRIYVDNDGYVTFSVYISEPQEMIPWIRSWGAGVVVLEPQLLREQIIRSLQRQIQNYGLVLNPKLDVSPINQLWAKYDRQTEAYHLLIYHLLDVGAVAIAKWETILGYHTKLWICDLLQVSETAAAKIIAVFVALHDIGKATPTFQSKASNLYSYLSSQFQERVIRDIPHGILSAIILRKWFSQKGISIRQANRLASVIGGHHGTWITSNEMLSEAAIGMEHWNDVQLEICNILMDLFSVDELIIPQDTVAFNAFATFLSGFVSVCDWIGSNNTYFPFETTVMEYSLYYSQTLEQAQVALKNLGWSGWEVNQQIVKFDEIFPFIPNILQRSVIEIIGHPSKLPRLIVIEYLTGSGKTELSLYLADVLLSLFKLMGIYIGMPTQATSNQMFERVLSYLETRYPSQPVNLQLIHGQSEHHPYYQSITQQPHREGDNSSITASQWFQNRKRSLLAPYAVGTIDQAMLSVLQVRHHFVRQYALSNKVIIFDEIHSYDTYMNSIIDNLLNWLVAMQSPIIMLSATLSQHNRLQLLHAVGAKTDQIPFVPYPRLTIVDSAGEVELHSLPKPALRTIYIRKITSTLDSLIECILPIYNKGGCIAIICNTVNEAIAVTSYLETVNDFQDNILLFHARFPPIWRAQIESTVLELFGKKGERPQKFILVATQIIEQSLDLDFDLIVTSTAPIDLLIQRMGRLHRHSTNNQVRPSHLDTPTMILRTPEITVAEIPEFGVDELIYGRYFLLRTWLLLREMQDIKIPDDIDAVMDFVYSDQIQGFVDNEPYIEALQEAHQDMVINDTRSQFSGKQYIIGSVMDKGLIGKHNIQLADDENHNIATRDIRPGIEIICIINEELQSLVNHRPTRLEVSHLLQYKITIQNQKARRILENLPLNSFWLQVPQLMNVRPIVFSEGYYIDDLIQMRLSKMYGLEIILKEE